MPSDAPVAKLTKSRRAAREAALRALYQADVAEVEPGEAIENVLVDGNFHAESIQLIRHLVLGVETELGNLDEHIRPLLASGWTLERLAIIDRCLIRMAVYELWHMPTIPPKVTANEAVLLAKRYGDEVSFKFVNGVIGKLIEASPKASWQPTQTVEEETDTESMPALLPEIEEQEIDSASQEFATLQRVGGWKLKTEDPD